MRSVMAAIVLAPLVLMSGRTGDAQRGHSRTSADTSLVEAAELAYRAELRAMSAYAREECGECPEQAVLFLAGSRHAYAQAVRLHPREPRAWVGLAHVLFSTGFRGDGEPVDSVLGAANASCTWPLP